MLGIQAHSLAERRRRAVPFASLGERHPQVELIARLLGPQRHGRFQRLPRLQVQPLLTVGHTQERLSLDVLAVRDDRSTQMINSSVQVALPQRLDPLLAQGRGGAFHFVLLLQSTVA